MDSGSGSHYPHQFSQFVPTSLTSSILAPSRSSPSCGHCGIFLPQCYSNHRVMFIFLHLRKRFGIAEHEHQISLWPMQKILINHISFLVKRLPLKTLQSGVLFHFTLVYNTVGKLKCSLKKKIQFCFWQHVFVDHHIS